jgi:hypothetical protein
MERRFTLKRAFFIALAIFGLYLLYTHLTTTEEDRIMAVFAAVERGLEERNSLAVLEHVSPSYRDSSGRKKADAQLLLTTLNRSANQVMVNLSKRAITVHKDAAGAHLVISARVVMGGREFEPLPEDGSSDMTVDLRKEAGTWRITGAIYPAVVEEWIRKFQSILSGAP